LKKETIREPKAMIKAQSRHPLLHIPYLSAFLAGVLTFLAAWPRRADFQAERDHARRRDRRGFSRQVQVLLESALECQKQPEPAIQERRN
jgi:hypothetical protein